MRTLYLKFEQPIPYILFNFNIYINLTWTNKKKVQSRRRRQIIFDWIIEWKWPHRLKPPILWLRSPSPWRRCPLPPASLEHPLSSSWLSSGKEGSRCRLLASWAHTSWKDWLIVVRGCSTVQFVYFIILSYYYAVKVWYICFCISWYSGCCAVRYRPECVITKAGSKAWSPGQGETLYRNTVYCSVYAEIYCIALHNTI